MKYFLHDSNAFNDEKITELYLKFGYEGLGLFYTALEKFASQEKPIKTTVIKSQLNVRKRLEKCWKFMEEIGIISSSNGDSFNKELLNYSEKYQIRKEKNAKKVAEWRLKQQNVTGYKPVSNPSKVKLSKVKESKGNNTMGDFLKDFSFLKDKSFTDAFNAFLEMRREKKRPATNRAIEIMLIKLQKYNIETAIAMLEQSTVNSWTDVYELKEKNDGLTKAQRSNINSLKKLTEDLNHDKRIIPTGICGADGGVSGDKV